MLSITNKDADLMRLLILLGAQVVYDVYTGHASMKGKELLDTIYGKYDFSDLHRVVMLIQRGDKDNAWQTC